jgi:hypothetical protein
MRGSPHVFQIREQATTRGPSRLPLWRRRGPRIRRGGGAFGELFAQWLCRRMRLPQRRRRSRSLFSWVRCTHNYSALPPRPRFGKRILGFLAAAAHTAGMASFILAVLLAGAFAAGLVDHVRNVDRARPGVVERDVHRDLLGNALIRKRSVEHRLYDVQV